MQVYRCRCGKSKFFGSDSPSPCQGCYLCETTYAQHPDDHKKPEPHQFDSVQRIETDEGEKTLSRCRWCYISRKEAERQEAHEAEKKRAYELAASKGSTT